MKSKLQSLIFAVSLVSIVTIGLIAWTQGKQTLKNRIFQQLTNARTAKVQKLEFYFNTLFSQVGLLAEDRETIEAMVSFNRGFRQLNRTFIASEWEKSLGNYYQNQFFPLLSDRLSKNEQLRYFNYRPVDQAGRYLQYYYIADNPNPIGKKEKLIDPGDGSEYTKVHIQYHPELSQIIDKFGFYDLFLINHKTKDVIYSVFKETDYASNLQSGPYSQTGLAEVVAKVLKNPAPDKIEISDAQPYRPSYEASATFVAAPIYNGSNLLGVLAIQVPQDKINQIVGNTDNLEDDSLGKTGESYIVGKDYLMRSVSRFWLKDKERFKRDIKQQGTSQEKLRLIEALNSTVGVQEIKTPIVESALDGQEGIDITNNYRGKKVLVSYSPLNIQGFKWAILSEMETQEAFAPLRKLEITLLIAGVIFLLLSALIAELVSRLFLKPLRYLISKAKQIEAGELETEVTINSQGEFAELAKVFNNVTKNLAQTNQKLIKQQQENQFLLHNILPVAIAQRYSMIPQGQNLGESLIVDQLKKVTIVYAHLVGVSNLSQWMSPQQVATLLTKLIDQFDATADNYSLERQKTSGADYMVVCGLTQAVLDQEKRAMDFSQAILKIFKDKEAEYKSVLGLKITIHAGSVTAGILGTNKFSYNLWGETVDLASQLYLDTPKNQILVTLPIHERVADNYTFIPYPIEKPGLESLKAWIVSNIPKIELSQVELVQSSFAKVVPISEKAGELFYRRLFEVTPSLRPLFKGEIKAQQRKLINTLAIAVEGLRNPEPILPAVQKLGRSHVGYGVKEEYYEIVGETLIWTLEQGLGEDFTPPVRAAWIEAYRFLSEIMKEAAHEVESVANQEVTTVNN